MPKEEVNRMADNLESTPAADTPDVDEDVGREDISFTT
jgi:hypothetical protein